MIEYYGMSLGVYPVGVYNLEYNAANNTYPSTLVASHPNYEVNFKDFSTFCLKSLDNRLSMSVKSFEAKVYCAGDAQIGWVNISYLSSVLSTAQNGTQGVGHGSNSICYDVVRGGMVRAGSFLEVPNASVKQGSVIRSEDRGASWYIDGKLIASTQKRDNTAQISSTGTIVTEPCISIKGKFEFVSIEFMY